MSESMRDGDASQGTAADGENAGPGQHRATQTGSVGDEATRLFAAAQDLLQRGLGSAQTSHIATGAAECTWCPLCQVIAVLRGDRPELSERLAETQTAVAGLLHALTDAVGSAVAHAASAAAANAAAATASAGTPPSSSGPSQPGAGTNASAPNGHSARVQKIQLDIQRPAEPRPSE